jgi:predicted permease
LSADAMPLFMPLFFAFGLILMIGCANVANLLLARGVVRQREIGIRLAVGASRRRVILQLLTESLLLALVSAALAFGISQFVLSRIVYTITSTFPADIGNLRLAVPPPDWRVGLFLVTGAVVSTVFFALAPALHATRVELVRAMRGEVVRDGRPGRARDALVALQVTGSVVLLICAAIFLRSSVRAAALDPGIRTSGIINLTVLNEQKREAILDVVRSEPLIASFAASSPGVLSGFPAFAEGTSGKSAVRYQFVSPEHFDVFGIHLVRGRGFAARERSASEAVAVVSESTARRLWPGTDAVGQTLQLEPDNTAASAPRAADGPPLASRRVTVVGVARDVPGFRLGGFAITGPDVYVPIGHEAARTLLTLRARGDVARARHALVDRLAALDPNMSDVSSLETLVRAGSYLLKIPFWLTLMLGTLALLLTLSGLFSVLSYLVEQRSREIAVRMAIGGTRQTIAALVLSQSARPVGIGLLLGGCFTAALGGVLLATPAAEYIGSVVRLFDPVAYAASLLCIVAACTCAALVPTLRAARIDPARALRRD